MHSVRCTTLGSGTTEAPLEAWILICGKLD
jgi:hypothetical protein